MNLLNSTPFSENFLASPFSAIEELTQDNRTERNYESMISERSLMDYNTEFSNIKNSLNKLDNFSLFLTETEIEMLNKEFDVISFNNSITLFKTIVCELYREYSTLEPELKKKKDLFEKFTQCVKNFTQLINKVEMDDQQFKDIIENKIINYYQKLQIEEYEEKYNNCIKKLLYLKNSIDNFKTVQNNYICPICFENNVDCFIDPCGHTLCSDCLTKIGKSICHVCRNEVTHYKKIYF